MAVAFTQRLSSGTLDYIGLAADVKPTPDQVWSLFFESDTGTTYVWTGTAWVELKAPTLASMVLAAGEAHIGNIGGSTVLATAAFTRPADTTAYAAKDAVSNSTSAPIVLTFTGLGRVVGGSGYITKARLLTDQAANVAQYRLHLFNVAPTAINDNSAYTLLWANRTSRISMIDIGPLGTEGTGSDAANGLNSDIRLAYKCAAADTALYGLLETLIAFTPASAQNLFVELTAEQN